MFQISPNWTFEERNMVAFQIALQMRRVAAQQRLPEDPKSASMTQVAVWAELLKYVLGNSSAFLEANRLQLLRTLPPMELWAK